MEVKLNIEDLWSGWEALEKSPKDVGTVEMIVCRPDRDEREEVQEAVFSIDEGMAGDNWLTRGSSDGTAHPEAQITLMNSRVIDLIAGDRSRWELAGDQLFVDFDISKDNLPVGQRIQIGEVILEIPELPHTGCAKFAKRYGAYARKFVMTDEGKQQRFRGIYAKVIQSGNIKVSDTITKL